MNDDRHYNSYSIREQEEFQQDAVTPSFIGNEEQCDIFETPDEETPLIVEIE